MNTVLRATHSNVDDEVRVRIFPLVHIGTSTIRDMLRIVQNP